MLVEPAALWAGWFAASYAVRSGRSLARRYPIVFAHFARRRAIAQLPAMPLVVSAAMRWWRDAFPEWSEALAAIDARRATHGAFFSFAKSRTH